MKVMSVVHLDGTEEQYAYVNYRIESGTIIIIRANKHGFYYDALIVGGFKKVFLHEDKDSYLV